MSQSTAKFDSQCIAVRALEAGKYPNNISELEAAVERAVAQSLQGQSQAGSSGEDLETKTLEIGEEVFWFASGQVRNRATMSYMIDYAIDGLWNWTRKMKCFLYAEN